MSLNLVPGGVLVSLGSDLVDVARIRGVWDRQGERFLERVFTEEERRYCLSMKYPHKHFAARFAAKEAVSKAFSTGIGPHLSWKSVSVYHGERMDPRVRLDAKGEALLREAGATHVLLTLAHTDGQAMAVAALVRAEEAKE
jgi:holo-[acyl-carrier protein] synthase